MTEEPQKPVEQEQSVKEASTEVATSVYNTLGSQYDVPKTPFHTHNGTDSPQLDPNYFLGFPIRTETPVDPAQNGKIVLSDISGIKSLWARIDQTWQEIVFGNSVQTAYKPTTETITSSTVLQNDNDLFIPIEANQVYSFEMYININSPAAADFKFNFTYPTSAQASWAYLGGGEINQNESSSAVAINTFDSNVTVGVVVHGYVRGASVDGNLQLVWAQQTSNGGNTSVVSGSWITATKLSNN